MGTGSTSGGNGSAVEVTRTRRLPMCRSCGSGAAVHPVAMPYVFRYLANELAAMGVRVMLELGVEGQEGRGSGLGGQPGRVLTLGKVKEHGKAGRA